MEQFQSVARYYTYDEFLQLMQLLVAQGRTTGPKQTDDLIFFTRLNYQRMQRWDKTFKLSGALAIKARTAKPQTWWLIDEAWCGDASQSLPVMNKIAEASGGNIGLRIIMRDENLPIIDRYLTNGGRSIPKLIAIDRQNNELFTWGPRPQYAAKLMLDWRASPNGKTLGEIEKELHGWYARDKGTSIEAELLMLL